MQKTSPTPTVKWNNKVKLIIADVDETIADNYTPAAPEMLTELTSLLQEGKVLFLVSGASLVRMKSRIIDHIPQNLRKQILVAHCSGVEVWGFQEDGEQQEKPFYSLYENEFTEQQKKLFREKVQQLITEFHLKIFDPMRVMEFKEKAGENPLHIMMEDRGPQITFEVVNGYDMSEQQEKALALSVPQTRGVYDLRIPILERAIQIFQEAKLPITPRLGGVWAIDFAIEGVNKTTAVKYILDNAHILETLSITVKDLQNPETIEIWGDKFSVLTGTDRHMSEALPKEVRSIDFREEDPAEFPEGYNIVVWDGQCHVHNGLLEYLQLRHKQ